MDRKEELEKKRKRLQELRKQTEERKQALQSTTTKTGTPDRSLKDVEELLSTLAGPQEDKGSFSSKESLREEKDKDKEKEKDKEDEPRAQVEERAEPERTVTMVERPNPKDFSSVMAVTIDIHPKEYVSYEKEVQTDPLDEEFEEGNESGMDSSRVPSSMAISEMAAEDQGQEMAEDQERPQWDITLSEEEKREILQSESFLDFIGHSSKIMERVLNEPYDYLIDYAKIDSESDVDSKSVKRVVTFFHESLCENRSVTDIDWSQKHPELLVASYDGSSNYSGPEGVVLVWNLNLRSQPEFTFHAPSPVVSTRFSPFHPNLVIGGTYSGQIMIWDNRAKHLPVQKTPLSSSGHTYPVYKMEVIGNPNANNLISVSNDGQMCTWSLDNLSKPQETVELVTGSKKDMAVTSFGFQETQTGTFMVGAGDGNVYVANRIHRTGLRHGINENVLYRGHMGPVTGVHYHPANPGSVDASNLFLTSSMDWSVKLWKTQPLRPNSQQTEVHGPLHSFEEFGNYVMDAAWSPAHPALFSAVDAEGKFSLFNLNADTEIPTASLQIDNKGLNKVRWDREGRRNAVASSNGRVHIIDIGELAAPKPSDHDTFQKVIAQMNPRFG